MTMMLYKCILDTDQQGAVSMKEYTMLESLSSLIGAAETAGFEFKHVPSDERDIKVISEGFLDLHGKWYVRHSKPLACPFFYGWHGPHARKSDAACAALERLQTMSVVVTKF